ncbi:peptide ABC transporter substrate-binding protein [Thiotrichales bacterium HSG14]|nr:peptide ABC transporter substrate-binding protein [Thiotrichales bacterium HSG14]
MLIISSCGQQDFQTPHQKKESHVGYLRIPINGIPTTIDPGLTYDSTSIELVEQLFLGLTDFDPKTYETVPELATNWQASEDNTVYTFNLRQDAKWTDGQPVTAHDIVWTIRRNITPEIDSTTYYTLYVIKNAEAIHRNKSIQIFDEYGASATVLPSKEQLGVRAIDDYTIEFTLEHPAGYFPLVVSLSTYRPLPRKVIEQYGKDWTKPENIVTNGSYQLSEWDKDSKLILKKNPNYYDANQVAIPEVHYHIVRKRSLGLAMYENNELDIMGGQVYLSLPPLEITRLNNDPRLRKEIYSSPHFCTEFYGFNTQKPPMNNLLVRKAIAAAINKQTLITFIMKANHIPAMTFTRPPIFGSVKLNGGVGIPFSPKQAKAWLAEAGYPEGKGFPQVILTHDVGANHSNIARGIKTILKHYLNIDIEVRALDGDRYYDIIDQPTTPHIFRLGWCADYPDANNWLHEVFHPDKGINWVGWDNREFAKVVDKAQQISDPQERQKLYRRAEQILTEEEAAIIPLYFSTSQVLLKPWVKGWYNMSFGGQHIRNWRLED